MPESQFKMAHMFSARGRKVVDGKVHSCGTAACIVGWTGKLFAPDVEALDFDSNTAAELLGLNDAVMAQLFVPEGYDKPGQYSRDDAVRVLNHLLATGEVQWCPPR